MSKTDSSTRTTNEYLNVDFMRSLVKQYSELGQWTSAFFWADAAAAAGGSGVPSGDDIWLLASAMLARGELHRAAHTVVSRDLHRRHLLCLGVVMRAYLSAKEPATALSLLEECDPTLLLSRATDQTHNRALAGVLVSRARCLAALERREAAAAALAAALRADVACYEALDLLLHQHALTPTQESELIESLPISSQLAVVEAAYVRAAYSERLRRYAPLPDTEPPPDTAPALTDSPTETEALVTKALVEVRSRSTEACVCRARRLAASCRWAECVAALPDPWTLPAERAAALLEMGQGSELFVFAHTLVNKYPHHWTAWFAVGCYYYLIGKSEFARRYLSKAKSLEPGAGCVWLAYGHSFAADNEHDQAMAAYFKASQLMPGCYLPPLYIGVECSLLYNTTMAQKFLLRAAMLHNHVESETDAADVGGGGAAGVEAEGWEGVRRAVRCAAVAHEAGAAAHAAGHHAHAHALWTLALHYAPQPLEARWAATLEALGHAHRRRGEPAPALEYHLQALAVRPRHAHTYTHIGLCQALLGREAEAAEALHAALALAPDDAVALALLDAVVDTLHRAIDDEDIPQFPFPKVALTVTPAAPATAPATPASAPGGGGDSTIMSDMSMSFD